MAVVVDAAAFLLYRLGRLSRLLTCVAVVVAANVLIRGTCAVHMEARYPCAFIDTVNISGSYAMDGNMSQTYVYQWRSIPRELVTVYDFVIQNGVRVPAERHLRACVCKVKPCVRFCCNPGYVYNLQNNTCTAQTVTLAQDTMEIVLANGTLAAVEPAAHFSVHVETPCDHMRAITKDEAYVHWTLYENGTVAHQQHIFSKHYCFTPMMLANLTWDWQPLACAPEKLLFVLGVREWTYAICLMICVICMFIVLFVYLICTEMRNTFYGVAIKAYAICIIIGYSLLAHLTLHDPAHLTKLACIQIPSVALLYVVLSFYILSFISFNLYLNFHGVILTKLMFWLILCPIVLIAVGWCFFVGFAYHGSRRVFGGDSCWFDPRNWSIMIYFYTPIFIACAICGFFYILTLIRISERREFEPSKSIAPLEANRLQSFWKFFCYTALSWLVCVGSFVFNYYRGERTHLNYGVCFFMAFHGFGALYALIGRNQQIQNFLRRIENNIDDEPCENSLPMTSY